MFWVIHRFLYLFDLEALRCRMFEGKILFTFQNLVQAFGVGPVRQKMRKLEYVGKIIYKAFPPVKTKIKSLMDQI